MKHNGYELVLEAVKLSSLKGALKQINTHHTGSTNAHPAMGDLEKFVKTARHDRVMRGMDAPIGHPKHTSITKADDLLKKIHTKAPWTKDLQARKAAEEKALTLDVHRMQRKPVYGSVDGPKGFERLM